MPIPDEVREAIGRYFDAVFDKRESGPDGYVARYAALERAIERALLLAEMRGLASAHDSWSKRELMKQLRSQADALDKVQR